MTIAISCPECGKTGHARDHNAGASVKCPDCGARVHVPPVSDPEESLHVAGASDSGGLPVARVDERTRESNLRPERFEYNRLRA